MSIEQICNSITNLFNKVRNPFPLLPPTLLACSLGKRPGLSTLVSTSNVVKDLNKLGVPTDPMPDGSQNLTVAVTHSIIKEIFRALKEDAAIQVAVVPGSGKVVVQGAGGTSVGAVVNTQSGNAELH